MSTTCATLCQVPTLSCLPTKIPTPLPTPPRPTPQCTEVDEPYGNIPTEQLKQQLLKEKAAKVGSARGRAP